VTPWENDNLDPTLKNERAEVRGLLHEVAGKEFGPRFAGRASVFVLDTLRRSVAAPTGSLRIIFIRGPNFEMLPAPHRTLGSRHRGRPNFRK